MQVSGRARLAWANRNLEAAADIIVADYLCEMAEAADKHAWALDATALYEYAEMLDPEGDN